MTQATAGRPKRAPVLRKALTAARRAGLLAAGLLLAGTTGVSGQDAGTTASSLLTLPAGSRATGLAGAYTAGADIDALFYNPAGSAGLDAAASLAYQAYVADIGIGSAAAAFRVGRFVLGAGVAYLDGGEIDVIEPDPVFGGQRGRETGATASAGETALRVTAATTLLRPELRVGLAAGYLATDLAGESDGSPLFDVGAQYSLPFLTVGLAARNLGGSLEGSGEAFPLPAEARAGAMTRLAVANGVAATLSADVVVALEGEGTAFAGGIEAGLVPAAGRDYTAVGRLGYTTASGADGLGGRLHIGGGLGKGDLGLDYTFQSLEYFGAIHRFGLRWNRLR